MGIALTVKWHMRCALRAMNLRNVYNASKMQLDTITIALYPTVNAILDTTMWTILSACLAGKNAYTAKMQTHALLAYLVHRIWERIANAMMIRCSSNKLADFVKSFYARCATMTWIPALCVLIMLSQWMSYTASASQGTTSIIMSARVW